MKKFLNKIFLCLSLMAMLAPTTYVFAEEEGNTGTTPTPTPTATPPSTDPDPVDPVTPTPTPPEKPDTSPTPTPTPSNKPTPTPSSSPESNEVELSIQGVKTTKSGNKYTAVVPSSTESITIVATKGKVQGDGTHSLKEGKNTFSVTGAGKTYTVEVTRATADLSLKSLGIQGQNLNESFEAGVLNYTADIPNNIENLNIKYATTTNNKDVRVQIVGDKNLKVGQNTVQVIVKNAAGETQEYRINVTRKSEDEEPEETDKDDEDTNTVSSSEDSTTSQIVMPDLEKADKGNPLRYVLVVLFCLVLLAISGIGIYFYIKTGDSEKRKQKKLEKLKKKQEKLNHELTNLNAADEETDTEILGEEQPEKENKIDELEDTIELDNINLEEETKEVEVTQNPKRRSDRNVLEDFDDLFLDE